VGWKIYGYVTRCYRYNLEEKVVIFIVPNLEIKLITIHSE
jgi:hypothetical protein